MQGFTKQKNVVHQQCGRPEQDGVVIFDEFVLCGDNARSVVSTAFGSFQTRLSKTQSTG
jgi:hypothetical protein